LSRHAGGSHGQKTFRQLRPQRECLHAEAYRIDHTAVTSGAATALEAGFRRMPRGVFAGRVDQCDALLMTGAERNRFSTEIADLNRLGKDLR
jgi:hypothetical protein